MSEDKIVGCIISGLILAIGIGITARGLGANIDLSWGIGFMTAVLASAAFIGIAKAFEIWENR